MHGVSALINCSTGEQGITASRKSWSQLHLAIKLIPQFGKPLWFYWPIHQKMSIIQPKEWPMWLDCLKCSSGSLNRPIALIPGLDLAGMLHFGIRCNNPIAYFVICYCFCCDNLILCLCFALNSFFSRFLFFYFVFLFPLFVCIFFELLISKLICHSILFYSLVW